MKLFAAEVEDEDEKLAHRLWSALGGRGAFRRFKDVLAGEPGLLEDWFTFTAERQRGRARFWLADAGYRVGARPEPSADPA